MAENEHPTENISLKQGSIDKEMIPLITWMNGFKEVFTMHSCQGALRDINQPYQPYDEGPYVMWMCVEFQSMHVFTVLMNVFDRDARTTVDTVGFPGHVIYTTRFRDQHALRSVMHRIDAK